MDRLIRATYAGLRARGRPARQRLRWLPAVAVVGAVVAGLALGAALGRSRLPAAAPTGVPVTLSPTTQIRGPVPTPRTPAPTSAGTTSPAAAERDMWSKVRSSISDPAAVLVPTWLPSMVDRNSLDAVTSRGAIDTYRVVYGTTGGGSVTFTMGSAEPEAGRSAIGLTIRGYRAGLSHDPDGYARPGLPKLVSWSEGGVHYGIRSETLSGDDLMRIAWSLESARPPARAFPYTRASTGACSLPGMDAEALVRRLLASAGNGDPDAMADCFALETLENTPGTWQQAWSALPRTRDVVVRDVLWFGGRQIVTASWTFERDPGGVWSPSATRFFVVGLDGDRLRAFSVFSGPASLPQ